VYCAIIAVRAHQIKQQEVVSTRLKDAIKQYNVGRALELLEAEWADIYEKFDMSTGTVSSFEVSTRFT
jgi:hypothetical protein